MKSLLSSLILILSVGVFYGQNVVVQGRIQSLAANFTPSSNTAVFYKYLDPEGEETIAAIPVNQYGIFQQFLPAETEVQIYIYYNRFVPIDTLIYTGSNEIMPLHFHVKAKSTHFTAEKARTDIEEGRVRIVFHDLEMYRLFRKANFQGKYGFHFEYLNRPDNWQELKEIADYNAVMEQHLDRQNPQGWREMLYAEMDSLIVVRESYAGLETVQQPQDQAVPEVQITEVLPQEEGALALQAKSVNVPETKAPEPTSDSKPAPVEQEVYDQHLSKIVLPKSLVPSLDLEHQSDHLVEEPGEPAITTEPKLELYIPSPDLEVPIAQEPKIIADQAGDPISPEAMPEELAEAASELSVEPVDERPAALPVVSAEVMEITLPVTEGTEERNEEARTEMAIARELAEELMAEQTVAKPEKTETGAEELAGDAPVEVFVSLSASNETLVALSGAKEELEPEPAAEISARTAIERESAKEAKTISPSALPNQKMAFQPQTASLEQAIGVVIPAAATVGPNQAYALSPILHHLETAQQKVLEKGIAEAEALYGQPNLRQKPSSWQYPQQAAESPQMNHLIGEKQQIYLRFYQGRTNWQAEEPVAFMLRKIDQDPDYQSFKVIQYWAAWHYQALIPELIFRLTDETEVGLTNAREIIIWDRVQEGDLELDGPGAEVADDLFTVGGRANYLLKNLTGEDFGTLEMHTSSEERIRLRDQWVDWLLNLQSEKISTTQG
jgi:hypothetical protein